MKMDRLHLYSLGYRIFKKEEEIHMGLPIRLVRGTYQIKRSIHMKWRVWFVSSESYH